MNNRLTNDISSIFALLRENTYQYSPLTAADAHLLSNKDRVQPSQTIGHSAMSEDGTFLLPIHSEAAPSTEDVVSYIDPTLSLTASILPSKTRSSSAVNISCQTPQSIQSKKALSTSGGTQDLLPSSQVNILFVLTKHLKA